VRLQEKHMQVIKPTPSQAAFVLKKFMDENGVSLKLSKAQEAVARLQGFANWNTLTSVMDPKVGTPSGPLLHKEADLYSLQGESGAEADIEGGNLRVQVKRTDEGVVVDVYSKQALESGSGGLEALGSTWVMFSEVEDENDDEEPIDPSDRRHQTPEDLLKSLLQATHAQDSSCLGPEPISNLNEEAIREELAWSGTVDTDREMFAFHNGSRTVSITLREILNASPMGETGWLLPDGNELWVFSNPEQAKNSEEAELSAVKAITSDLGRFLSDYDARAEVKRKKHETSNDLLRKVLSATHATDEEETKRYVITYANESVVRRALAGKASNQDLEASALEFRNAKGFIRVVSLGELVEAEPHGATGWSLPEGRLLYVLNDNMQMSTKPEVHTDAPNLDKDQKDLLKQMLEATAVALPDTEGKTPIQRKAVGLLERVLNGGSYEPADEAIQFDTTTFRRGITIQALLCARRDSKNSWVLPSGDELTLYSGHMSMRALNSHDEATWELLEKLKTADRLGQSIAEAGNPILSRNSLLIEKALRWEAIDQNEALVTFRGEVYGKRAYVGLSLLDLLKAEKLSDTTWRLFLGDLLQVYQPVGK
jgi:hypothetical protein